jgi:von Willebrand factor type A domain
MPNPSINSNLLGQTTYSISNSKALIADLRFDVPTVSPFPQFSVKFPASAMNPQITLKKGGISLDLLPGPINDNNSTFANRHIIANTTPDGFGNTILSCEISATAAPAAGEVWSVLASATNPVNYEFTQGDNNPGTPTITRLMCDPVATFTPAPAMPKEKETVTLTADPATGPALTPTVVGLPLPPINYSWTYAGNIAINDFPACGASQIFAFTAPGVYGDKLINITLNVTFEGSCMPFTPGFLHNTSPAQGLTIKPRTQHLMLVLDRSGSMSGPKWENAKTAARIMTHLFIALRQGVTPSDRLGIQVFEDTNCTWHPGSTAGTITAPVMALSTTSAADTNICPLNFGPAGTCTNIGDAMLKAMDDLATLGVGDNPKFTIILLTDGYENSGQVRIDPNTPAPAGVQNFAVARTATAARQNVDSRLSIYTIGLGSTVQDDVLDNLPLPMGAGPAGIYRNVLDISQLKDAIAQMVSFSQEAATIIPNAAPPAAPDDPDPNPPSQPRYFKLDPQVNRMALAISWATDPTNTIELARRDRDPVTMTFKGPFTPVNPPVKNCPTHGFVSVDVASLFGGDETAVPATQWRVVHKKIVMGVLTPQPILDTDLLIFVDLFVKADIVFDQTAYQTGDPMVITARLRAGDQPITDARVHVELARPGESLGTFLATNGSGYKPAPPRGPDPAHPKLAMLQTLLRQKELNDLPILRPVAIFTDGTNELFDDGVHSDGAPHDGNFANVYNHLDKEGTYTWRFFIEGRLADGSQFNRLMTISKWVSVAIDLDFSIFNVVDYAGVPAGFIGKQIFFLPKSKSGEFLGPFRTAEIDFKTSAGNFSGDMISHPDGQYSRLLIYKRGESPVITVQVRGKDSTSLKSHKFTVDSNAGCLYLIPIIGPWLAKLFGK